MERILSASKNEVLGRLRLMNLTLKSFALEDGFNVNTVQRTVLRYVGTGKSPTKGEVSIEILNRLEKRIWG